MIRFVVVLALLGSACLAPVLTAEELGLKIGAAAPEWKELPGIDGKQYSLADFQNKPVLIVVFFCNSCDYAKAYEERLAKFAIDHCSPDGKVALVAINVNKIQEDAPAEMKKRAEQKGFTFPYLFDETQAVAKAHQAIFTPEFFVFDAERKLAYHGALDDNSNADMATKHYLADAVKSLLAGEKPLTAETAPVGCLIRYERRRREKSK